jgi:hypothetical protein
LERLRAMPGVTRKLVSDPDAAPAAEPEALTEWIPEADGGTTNEVVKTPRESALGTVSIGVPS